MTRNRSDQDVRRGASRSIGTVNRLLKGLPAGISRFPWLLTAASSLAVLSFMAVFLISQQEEGNLLAVRGGTIIPISGEPIENGVLLVRGGKIVQVGADVTIPQGAQVVDASGQFVMPGLVDAMNYFGIDPDDLNETYSPITPQIRIIQGFYPFGDFGKGGAGPLRLKPLLSGGVTSMYIAPGEAAIIGGQGAVVKTAGPDFESLVLREPAAIDMTLGEPPKKAFGEKGRSPATRMAVAAMLRQALIDAQAYARNWGDYESKSGEEKEKASQPKRDLANEALSKLLAGEIPARVQADRVDDIRTALRIAEEFGFTLVLDGAAHAHELGDELARQKVAAVLGPITGLPYASVDRRGADDRNAALLHEAGVKLAIASHSRGLGNLATASTGRWLLLDAAFARAYGLPEEAILRALTLDAAEILGVADRVGSLTPGKDADFIILNGPPLRMQTWVEQAYVNGRQVYQRPSGQ